MPPAIDLARHYAVALAAIRVVHDFDDWIGQVWLDRRPAPVGAVASRGALGTQGAIVWHESKDTVFGDRPGDDGCPYVPRTVPLPEFSFVLGKGVNLYGQDVVICAAMRGAPRPPGS